MSEPTRSLRTQLRSLRMLIGLTFRADRVRATAVSVLVFLNDIAIVVAAVSAKLLIDAVGDGDDGGVRLAAFVFGAAVGLGLLGDVLLTGLRVTLMDRTRLLVDEELMRLSSGIPTLDHLDDPAWRQELDMLKLQKWALTSSVDFLVLGIGRVLRVLGATIVLATIQPVLLVLPVLAVPALVAAARGEAVRKAADEQTVELVREVRYLAGLASNPSAGREIRLFGLADELRRRRRVAADEVETAMARRDRRMATTTAIGRSVYAVGFGAAAALVAWRAFDGAATVGDLVLFVVLGAQLNLFVSEGAMLFGEIARMMTTVQRFEALQDYSASVASRSGHEPAPERLTTGIELEHVSFAYGSGGEVLSDASVVLPSGSVVAVVGQNGAGKTTLVKLIAQLHRPTAGRITVDGRSLDTIDPDAWGERLSATFQDFAPLEFILSESIGCGDLPRMADADAVATAVERGAATEVVAAAPNGLDTELGGSFELGTQLSGGQWQRVALARGMMREPLVLVLDEPTASLDPSTEYTLLQRHAEAARRWATERGGITVLVSHRLATARLADLILMVDGGRITEVGSHDELLARGGGYAELFELQRKAYAE